VKLRPLCGVFIRVILSVVFAGIFYTGWMAVAIPVLKLVPSKVEGSRISIIVLKTIVWLAAPVVTALGFTAGVFIFELLQRTRKSKFLNIFKWSLAGCAIGAGAVVWFGPMLIVFGMFLVGTASVALREIIRLRRDKRNVSCDS
jgi:hypothetical protein